MAATMKERVQETVSVDPEQRQPGMTRVVREELPVFLDPIQAARIISTSPKFIRNHCIDGTIKAVKCGRVWRINRDAFLEQFGVIA